MTWSTPPTWTAGQTIPASNLNIIRDDLLETAAAKATTAGRYFAVSGVNTLAERELQWDFISSSQTTTSTSYANLATVGPTVSVVHGARMLVWHSARIDHSASGETSSAAVDFSGAFSSAATDNEACYRTGTTPMQFGTTTLHASLTPGTTTCTVKYRVNNPTGTFSHRRITVMPL